MDALSREYSEGAILALRIYLRSTARAQATQERVLSHILNSNASSAFGQQHDFGSIDSPTAYAARVPARNYGELAPWIERAANGEPNVLTEDPPLVFHRTSSSTGEPKKVPVTRAGALFRVRNAGAHAAALLMRHQEICESVDSTLSLTINPPSASETDGAIPWCFLSQTDWSRLGIQRHPGMPGSRAPWLHVPDTIGDTLYYRLRLALESPLRGILSWFPASVLQLAATLDAQWGTIVREIHDGTVCGATLRTPNPARARELERLGAANRRLLQDVWPSLSVIECWKTSTSEHYLAALQAVAGPDVEIFPAGYGSTESPVALALSHDSTAGLLDVTCAFFEFIAVDEPADDRALLAHELERGRDYRLVITTMSGLYRYELGDVVRVHEFINGVPIVEFRYRVDVAVSLVSEKLTEAQAMASIRSALATCDDAAGEGSLSPLYAQTPRYVLLVEGSAGITPDRVPGMAASLDASLCDNVNYAFYRSTGLVAEPIVDLLEPGTFGEWRRERCQAGHTALPQQKHRVIVDPGEYAELKRISAVMTARRDARRQPERRGESLGASS